jgi:hypothetical protein
VKLPANAKRMNRMNFISFFCSIEVCSCTTDLNISFAVWSQCSNSHKHKTDRYLKLALFCLFLPGDWSERSGCGSLLIRSQRQNIRRDSSPFAGKQIRIFANIIASITLHCFTANSSSNHRAHESKSQSDSRWRNLSIYHSCPDWIEVHVVNKIT